MTVAFTMTERADQLRQDIALAHSAALVQAFLAKHHVTQVVLKILHPLNGDFSFGKTRKSQGAKSGL